MDVSEFPVATPGKKPAAVLSPQQKAARTRAKNKAAKEALATAEAAQLAQIVNLHIAGFSLAQIGQSIGATADEVDRMLASDAARYVRSQPALRIYVRNFISDRYSKLLDAIWDDATDKTTNQKLTVQGFDRKLASQDRAIKILDSMAKLHGAHAPVQTEVKVEAAPEAVDKLVQMLAGQQGLGYDVDVFDAEIVEELDEVVHEVIAASPAALEAAHSAVERAIDDGAGVDYDTGELLGEARDAAPAPGGVPAPQADEQDPLGFGPPRGGSGGFEAGESDVVYVM